MYSHKCPELSIDLCGCRSIGFVDAGPWTRRDRHGRVAAAWMDSRGSRFLRTLKAYSGRYGRWSNQLYSKDNLGKCGEINYIVNEVDGLHIVDTVWDAAFIQ